MSPNESGDEISQLLQQKTTPLYVSPWIFILIAIILIGVGGYSLIESQSSPIVSVQPLPPYPSAQKKASILQQASSAAMQTHKIPLNQATLDELDQIPGIGRMRATTLITKRPFANEHDLKGKTGWGDSLIEKIIPYVKF